MPRKGPRTQAEKERENARDRARRAERRDGTYAPRVPQGPSGNPPTPHLAEGLELAGQSVRTDASGAPVGGWDIGRRTGNPNPEPPPPDFALTGLSTMTRGDGSEAVRWRSWDRAKIDQHLALMKAWDDHAARYEGFVEPAPAPERTSAQTLALYPIGDHHLGMLAWWRECGESWDLKLGQQYLTDAFGHLVELAPASDRAIIANLGDFTHAQDQSQLTPGHGNKLDVDGRQAKVRDVALMVVTTITDLTLRHHKHVTWHHVPGNHDVEVAAALAREMRAWYRNEPRVTIADAYAPHQYARFGQNLFGFHHGDRTPANELAGVMAVDCPEWSETAFHYWHCGHVHHKSRDKEHPGVIVETHRILPPGDAWHRARYRAGRGMSVITYDRDDGEIARSTVGIERLRRDRARTEVTP